MDPAPTEATRIADKYLAGSTIESRKACALEILEAIHRLAALIAADVIKEAFEKAKSLNERPKAQSH